VACGRVPGRRSEYPPRVSVSAEGATCVHTPGLLGVGGGFLIVPVLVLALGLPMATAIGTSLLVVAVNSAAGFAAHLGDTSLDVPVTVAFASAAVLSALVAGRLGVRTDTDRLRRWFAWLVLAVAALVGTQVLVALLR
jgi:uncharacterized protein